MNINLKPTPSYCVVYIIQNFLLFNCLQYRTVVWRKNDSSSLIVSSVWACQPGPAEWGNGNVNVKFANSWTLESDESIDGAAQLS